MPSGLLSVDGLVNAALLFFCGRITYAVVLHRHMFVPKYGRGHRLLGLLMLVHITVGLADARLGDVVPPSLLWVYDAILSILGFSVSFSAARDFGRAHTNVKNDASGILDEQATVSVSEMVEHCFYQLLNLVQILYIHALPHLSDLPRARVALAMLVAAPWAWRGAFPVNSFSQNYKQAGVGGTTPLIRVLYRLKKYQYLLYKHFLLHGLNASISVDGLRSPLATSNTFRLYWLCLNTAYVMEFFMQTLVKRGYMSQHWMMALQQCLMLVSTYAALEVLEVVRLVPALLSLGLNFGRRGREVSNMAIVLLAARLLPAQDHCRLVLWS